MANNRNLVSISEDQLGRFIKEAIDEITKDELLKHRGESLMYREHGNPNRFDDRRVQDKFDPRNNGKGDWYRDDREEELKDFGALEENTVGKILNAIKHETCRFLNESARSLSKKSMAKIKKATDDLARSLYGDRYGQVDDKLTSKFFPKGDYNVTNDMNIASGMFTIGNEKLSDDTLIINFNSALGCPSINDCPITQQACYAVAGEIQYGASRRKRLMVQKLVNAARRQDKLGEVFNIARLYIEEASKSKKKIRYIRFNEAGDFVDQKMLVAAAKFAKAMKEEYGVISMAYTANKRLDTSELVDGMPIDSIIAVNRSRNDIKHSEDSLDRKFYGIPMDTNKFSTDPNVNLENSYCDVVDITDDEANKLHVVAPMKNDSGQPSIPVLSKGKWSGGEGYYYVCPCSFWRYNKDKATKEFCIMKGYASESDPVPTTQAAKRNMLKQLSPEDKKELDRFLKKIKSPCGIKCAVCHDIDGGVYRDPSGKVIENIKNYSVLTATHGANQSKYHSDYADAKRAGDDSAVYDKDNKNGHYKGFPNPKTQSPINNNLLTHDED